MIKDGSSILQSAIVHYLHHPSWPQPCILYSKERKYRKKNLNKGSDYCWQSIASVSSLTFHYIVVYSMIEYFLEYPGDNYSGKKEEDKLIGLTKELFFGFLHTRWKILIEIPKQYVFVAVWEEFICEWLHQCLLFWWSPGTRTKEIFFNDLFTFPPINFP